MTSDITPSRPLGTKTYGELLKLVSIPPLISSSKVSVVGIGKIGAAIAFSLVSSGVCSEMAMVDLNKDVVTGERSDLVDGISFLGRRCNILADSSFAVTKGSKLVIITAAKGSQMAEYNMKVIETNVRIYRFIIPEIVKYSPDAILIVVSNPPDVMAWVAWKISGLPKHRVISTGTMLDTSRFKHIIAEELNIGQQSVHGYIIGEHGSLSVAVWSTVVVAGTRLLDLAEDGSNNVIWEELHQKVIESNNEILKLKGPICWGIAMMCTKLVECILKNQRTILTVGTIPEGWNRFNDDVFISIPCVVGESGISHIVSMPLTDLEMHKLRKTIKTFRDIVTLINL